MYNMSVKEFMKPHIELIKSVTNIELPKTGINMDCILPMDNTFVSDNNDNVFELVLFDNLIGIDESESQVIVDGSWVYDIREKNYRIKDSLYRSYVVGKFYLKNYNGKNEYILKFPILLVFYSQEKITTLKIEYRSYEYEVLIIHSHYGNDLEEYNSEGYDSMKYYLDDNFNMKLYYSIVSSDNKREILENYNFEIDYFGNLLNDEDIMIFNLKLNGRT